MQSSRDHIKQSLFDTVRVSATEYPSKVKR